MDSWEDLKKDGLVCVDPIQAIAVFANADGDVVIRQRSQMLGEDPYVVIPRQYIKAVVSAIRSAVRKE